IDAQQHREELGNRFFMRVHFDISDISIPVSRLREGLAGLSEGFGMSCRLTLSGDRDRVAILVSRYDHCLYDLLLRNQYGELSGDIAVVASNHPDLADVAGHFGIPFVHVPVLEGRKAEAEAQILALLQERGIDLVVLARYMQILTPTLVDPYRNR